MLSYFEGVPGSGKTYYAVDIIFNNFSSSAQAKKNIKKDYLNCYTNINGFNYKLVNNVNRLDFDLLYKCLERLHKHYKAKKDDTYLIKLSRRYKLHKSLFIIDEAHNHFDTPKVVLTWWLTYHRHLFHDIILITQNLSLINSKYKPIAEAFYKAVPKTLSLNPTSFTYKMYVDSKKSKASQGGKVTVKKRKEVFALYQSGDSIETKNIILKFLLIAIGIFATLGFLLWYVSHRLAPKSNVKTIEKTPSNKVKNNSHVVDRTTAEDETQNDEDYSEKKFLSLSCSINKCSNEVISIPPQLLKVFINNESINVLYVQTVNKFFTNYYLDTTTDFYNYLIPNEGSDNEKDSTAVDVDFLPASKQ